jgi:hypothetical protein
MCTLFSQLSWGQFIDALKEAVIDERLLATESISNQTIDGQAYQSLRLPRTPAADRSNAKKSKIYKARAEIEKISSG